jgi:hypothetical protein
VWILPVSTWLPRGALALPAAAFLLVLIVAPVLPAFFTHPGLAPTRDDLVTAWLALLIGAPLIAGFSFVLGRRRGGGLGASAWRGLLLTLLLATPGWSRVGSYVSRWDHLDPNDASFRIGASARSLVGSSGRYAFLTTHHQFDSDGPSHAIAVDLTDGSWQELGRAGDEFWPVGNYRNTSAVPFVARFGASDTLGRHFSTYAEADAALERWIVLDADTLATKAVAHQRDLPDPFRASEEASRCERIANALWLPGGQRVWMQDRQLVTDATDGGVRVLNESKMTRSSWALPIGHGMRLFGTNGVVVYDALREQRFEIPNSVTVHFVRPGRWLVSRDLDPQHHRETCLYDPESGAFTPLPQPIAKCEFPIFLDDGRCLAIARDPDAIREAAARHGASPPGSLSVVDLDTGARESIALPPWFEGGLQYAELEGRTPAGALVIKLAPSRSGAGWCHARVDLAAHRMVAAGDANQYCNELLGCTDESTLYVVAGEQRLLRGHFGSAAFDLVFPKAAR